MNTYLNTRFTNAIVISVVALMLLFVPLTVGFDSAETYVFPAQASERDMRVAGSDPPVFGGGVGVATWQS